MKRYTATPILDEHGKVQSTTVTVTVGKGRAKTLQPTIGKLGYGWGDGGPASRRLAIALLYDALDGNDARTYKFYVRFLHRVIASRPATVGWSMDEEEVLGLVEEMENVENQSASARRAVSLEPAPVVNEGGMGIGGSPIKAGR